MKSTEQIRIISLVMNDCSWYTSERLRMLLPAQYKSLNFSKILSNLCIHMANMERTEANRIAFKVKTRGTYAYRFKKPIEVQQNLFGDTSNWINRERLEDKIGILFSSLTPDKRRQIVNKIFEN